jgi:uncharacterized membrane protein YphA (DoxX/SURF4 family)
METLIKFGRINYALGMAGMGLQQFFYPGFRPVFLPGWPEMLPDPQLLIYLSSLALMALGACIIFNFKAKKASLICGGVLLVFFILFHFPFQVFNNPMELGAWANAFKILALSGGAFVMAGSYLNDEMQEEYKRRVIIQLLEKLIPVGRIFFSITLITFGVVHFLYAQGVATLVPDWIPFHLFWTYFAAVSLIGAGISIIFNIKLRLVGILTGFMIFSWFLILHIPRAVAMPELANGNEVTSVFQALAFSGIAFVLAFGYHKQKNYSTNKTDHSIAY